MSEQNREIYEFGIFQLDVGKGILLRENQPVPLQWKTFETLCVLVKSGGILVTRDELMDKLWADTFVEENNLSQHIRALRKALGENGNGSEKFIETVTGRGFRFLPEVRIIKKADEGEVINPAETFNQLAVEDISGEAAFESLTINQPTIISHVSGNGNEAKAIVEDKPYAQSVIQQDTNTSPIITGRRTGFRRGLKFLLWGVCVGFGFLIIVQILQISSVMLFATPNNLSKELLEMTETFLDMLFIPTVLGYSFGIGLCLFGISRIIYALFEKENSKLHSSLVERWIAIVLISVISAVAIPNLIASYRAANEFRQNRKQKSAASSPANDKAPQFLNFSSVKYQKIIETQRGEAAISPDGRFVVYTNIVGDKQTLWLRQLAANTNIQILPPTEADYRRLKFSHDSEYIYFNHKNNLYRVSVLGGEVMPVMKEIADFSFSPDNTQIAFTKPLPDLPDYQCGLFVANADGSAERMISRRQSPDCYKSVTWSPDGKLIVFAVGQSDTGDANTQLFAYQIADEKEIVLSEARWFHINSLSWLPDQSGIILTGRKKLNEENQLWQVNNSNGETRQLTQGTARYIHLSLTVDGSRLLATQTVLDSNLSIAPANVPSNLRKLGSAFYGLTWLADGKIVYSSHADKNSLWTVKPDGTERKQLTFDDAGYLNPIASADGRYIFYTLSDDGRQHIWRMNADGSGKIQLTNGDGEQKPNVSPDGKWLFYQTSGKSPLTIWKVSTEGGEPVQLIKDYSINASASPDGKLLAYFGRKEPDKDIMVIKVLSLEDGQIVRQFSLPEAEFFATSKILWTKDGKDLIYTKEKIDRIANIWTQPLDGSQPKQITNYSSERIFDFGWSPDGKQLAVIHGGWKNEAVLISGFR